MVSALRISDTPADRLSGITSGTRFYLLDQPRPVATEFQAGQFRSLDLEALERSLDLEALERLQNAGDGIIFFGLFTLAPRDSAVVAAIAHHLPALVG